MFCCATVTLPFRDDASGFAAPVMTATPLPVPLAPDAIESQDELDCAVHAQFAAVVTVTFTVAPPAAMLVVAGET